MRSSRKPAPGIFTASGMRPPALTEITHTIIREFVGHLHDQGLEKSSIARKLAALRSFCKYCVREGILKENPARLVPTPKLPKRIPPVLSAEEMNIFVGLRASVVGGRLGGGLLLGRRGALGVGARQRKEKGANGEEKDAGRMVRMDSHHLELYSEYWTAL